MTEIGAISGDRDCFDDKQGTRGLVTLAIPLALLHTEVSGFPFAEVRITWSIKILEQPKLEQLNLIACSLIEVPLKLVNATSLTFTSPFCIHMITKKKRNYVILLYVCEVLLLKIKVRATLN